MDAASDDLLAGARLAEDDGGELRRRDALDVGRAVIHLRAADEVSEGLRLAIAGHVAVDPIGAAFLRARVDELEHRIADADLVVRLELDLADVRAVDHRAVAAAEILEHPARIPR